MSGAGIRGHCGCGWWWRTSCSSVAQNSDGVLRCNLPTVDTFPPSSQTTRLCPRLSVGRPLDFHCYFRPKYFSSASLLPRPNSSAAGDIPQRSSTTLQSSDEISSTGRWPSREKDILRGWERGACERRMSQRFVHLLITSTYTSSRTF